MKRIFILVAIALCVVSVVSAEQSVLIDFSNLVADIIPDQDNDKAATQNRATMMDFGKQAGASFSGDDKRAMKTSLALENWDVVLASSSRTPMSQAKSFVVEAPSKEFTMVMGLRVSFPVAPFNSWAIVKPPFEIPAFEYMAQVDDEGNVQPQTDEDRASKFTRFEQGNGVLKNVGSIKAVQVRAYGLNFPHTLSTIIIDSFGNEQIMQMGNLQYDGWGTRVWRNPNYIQNVRNREVRLYPLYPKTTPFIKFGGFLVQRDAAHEGGDFIAYFKDVEVIYDKAVLDTNRDIDDERIWNIVAEREEARKNFEISRFGQMQVLRHLEKQRLANETFPQEGPLPSAGT